MTIRPQPKVVVSTVKFLKWQPLYDTEKPFYIFTNIPSDAEDQRRSNLVFEDCETIFEDVTDRRAEFSLDRHGFCFVKTPADPVDFEDKELITTKFFAEVKQTIQRNVEGADRIHIFDWRLRKSGPSVPGTKIDLLDPTARIRPSNHVHIDQAPEAVIGRVVMELPDEADELLKGRVRIINFWRPLTAPVEDWPLGLCDGATLEQADLVETDHIRMNYGGATYNVVQRPKQKWFFLDRQGPEDVTLIKIFDSDPSVAAKYCAHAAFQHPLATSELPRRESIEVRALVFTDP